MSPPTPALSTRCSTAKRSSACRFPIVFLFMIPPPPRSTLFPYTTLFRSASTGSIACGKQTLKLLHDASPLQIDRKSTRLNSSHRCISYAVFCLKKKNDTADRTTDLPTRRAYAYYSRLRHHSA